MANNFFKSNAKEIAKEVEKLRKKLTKEVGDEAEQVVYKLLESLKQNLQFVINNQIRDGGSSTSQSTAQRVAEGQAIGKKVLASTMQNWATDATSPIYRAFNVYDKEGNRNLAMRVKSELTDNSSYEDYLNNFEQSLTNKVFAIEDRTGNYNYYTIPPNSLLLDQVLEDVKIFCSEYTDKAGENRPTTDMSDDGEPLTGIGRRKGEAKFERDRNKGFTEFTLKSRSLKLIETMGQNVTDVVLATQHGEYQDAATLAAMKSGPAAEKIKERTTQNLDESNLSPEAASLGKSNQAIKGMRVTRNSSEQGTKISITVDAGDLGGAAGDIGTQEVGQFLAREAVVWASGAQGPLKVALSMALQKAIDEFNKKG